MSTRCNVIVKDNDQKLIFYRHSDGYPEGVKETLDIFCEMIKNGQLRRNVQQAAGWLIVLGHEEYALMNRGSSYNSWKVGAYEPTDNIHGDIEHLYEVDLMNASWKEISIPKKILADRSW